MDDIRGMQDEYTKPKVTDHGDLQELTAAGGGTISDMPIGTPISPGPAPVVSAP